MTSVMLPRLLVIGAGGQLGQALMGGCRRAGFLGFGLARCGLDVSQRHDVATAIGQFVPDLVVNAAAYTAVDRAESEAGRAFAINRDGAEHVAAACAARGVPLIHLSSAYVFDGVKHAAYRESDAVAPLSVYGHSKAAGEARILACNGRAAIVRTSWLFGRHGDNLVKTVLRAAIARQEPRIAADHRSRPTGADDLAAGLLDLGRLMMADASLAGCFHFAGDGALTRRGFAAAILDHAALRLGRLPRVKAVAAAELPHRARRPRNATLDCTRMIALGIRPPSWRPAMAALVDDLLDLTQPRHAAVPQSRSQAA